MTISHFYPHYNNNKKEETIFLASSKILLKFMLLISMTFTIANAMTIAITIPMMLWITTSRKYS